MDCEQLGPVTGINAAGPSMRNAAADPEEQKMQKKQAELQTKVMVLERGIVDGTECNYLSV